MKKRILSLIMAVCMVATLVPALVLTATAALNSSFTTVMDFGGDNWPTYEDNEFTGFHGNWSVGYFKNGVYGTSEVMDSYKIISPAANQWSETGLYLQSGRFIVTGGDRYYQQNDAGITTKTVAFAYTYTAPYEGTVDLNMTAVKADVGDQPAPPEGETAQMYIAVMINNKVIWPVNGGSITNPADMQIVSDVADLSALPNAAGLKNVEIKIGDEIRFVAARYNTSYATMTPSVTYHDGYNLVPTKLDQSFSTSEPTWPAARAMAGVGDMQQTDKNWTLGAYKAADKAFTAHTVQRRLNTDTWTCVDRDATEFSKNSGILLKSTEKLNGAYFFGTTDAAAGIAPAFRAIAIATGEATFSVDAGTAFLANANFNAVKNGTASVDVYLNNEKIGTVTLTTDASGVVTVGEAVADVKVNKGDEIVFAASAGTGVKAVSALPLITYANISSFMNKPTTEQYDIATEDAAVTVGDNVGLQFKAYATLDTYKDSTAANLYVWDASVADKTLENATAVIPLAVDAEFAYTANYAGFAPKEMNDEITTQIVVLKDDTVLCQSEQATFTVAETAQKQFDAATTEEERDLMAAVMNYGAYAQKYFKYNETDLANKDLPGSYATIKVDDYQYFAKFGGQAIGNLISASEIEAFSLYLDGEISICLDIMLDEYEKNNCQVYVQHGLTEDECYGDREGLAVDLEKGIAIIDGIALDKLSEVHYIRLAVQDGRYRYVGYAMTYSVESFAARMMDSSEANLPELLVAMMELGKLA